MMIPHSIQSEDEDTSKASLDELEGLFFPQTPRSGKLSQNQRVAA